MKVVVTADIHFGVGHALFRITKALKVLVDDLYPTTV